MKYDSGIAYFMANELYYQGCPKITYVQLKDLTKLFKDEDLTGAKLAEEMKGQTVDVASLALTQSDLEAIGETTKGKCPAMRSTPVKVPMHHMHIGVSIHTGYA